MGRKGRDFFGTLKVCALVLIALCNADSQSGQLSSWDPAVRTADTAASLSVVQNVTEAAKRQFARRHFNAAERLKRQGVRLKVRSKSTSNKRDTKREEQTPSPPYRAFIDQPEYAPRYDPDRIHREVASRSERFVARTGFGPQDATEAAQLDQASRQRGPSNLEVMATQKQMEKEVAAEERKLKLQDAQTALLMESRVHQEEQHLMGKRRHKSKAVLTRYDQKLIREQAHIVEQHVSNVADHAINAALEYDEKGAQPVASHRQLAVTATKIAHMVVDKMRKPAQTLSQARAKAPPKKSKVEGKFR